MDDVNINSRSTPTLIVALRSAGFSQKALAAICGKSEGLVSRWCTGQLRPDPASLETISALLGLPPDKLLEPVAIDGDKW